MDQPDSRTPKPEKQDYIRWLGVATEFCGVLAVCSYGGYRLDQALHSSPWFLIGGFFVGFVGMLILIVKEGQRMR